MKKFSKFMAEAGQPEIPNEPTYGRNPSNGYLNDEVVKKLNAVVGRIFSEDQFDPEGKLTLARSSLSKIGLTFDPYPTMTESNGSFSLPLTLFGGRFGKDVNTPHNEFLEDDGISNQIEGGLSLNISYEMTETNQCRLRAKIA
jgi:hypothetical protein|tara:strand:- start:3222 stop:3650 length:429 start_codon:yes stop_codon:yes gene_type:complete